jgi:hypothetical protein
MTKPSTTLPSRPAICVDRGRAGRAEAGEPLGSVTQREGGVCRGVQGRGVQGVLPLQEGVEWFVHSP